MQPRVSVESERAVATAEQRVKGERATQVDCG